MKNTHTKLSLIIFLLTTTMYANTFFVENINKDTLKQDIKMLYDSKNYINHITYNNGILKNEKIETLELYVNSYTQYLKDIIINNEISVEEKELYIKTYLKALNKLTTLKDITFFEEYSNVIAKQIVTNTYDLKLKQIENSNSINFDNLQNNFKDIIISNEMNIEDKKAYLNYKIDEFALYFLQIMLNDNNTNVKENIFKIYIQAIKDLENLDNQGTFYNSLKNTFKKG